MKYLTSIIKHFQYGVECFPLWGGLLDQKNFIPGNVTVANYNGHIIYAVRLVSYLYPQMHSDKRISQTMFLQWPVVSKIVIGSLDGFYKQKELDIPVGDHAIWGTFTGPEDPRLYVWNNRVYMNVAHAGLENDKVVQLICEFDEDFTKIEQSFVVDSPNKMEKNWAPIEGTEHEFVYDPSEGSVIKVVTNAEHPERGKIFGETIFRNIIGGSSQVIPYKDEKMLSITHSRSWNRDTGYTCITYNHFINILEYKDGKMHTIESIPFNFITEGIEFCCGLTHDEHYYYIGFSVRDSSIHVMRIPKTTFEYVLYALKLVDLQYDNKYWVDSFNESRDEYSKFIYRPAQLCYVPYVPKHIALDIIKGNEGMIPQWILDQLRLNVTISK